MRLLRAALGFLLAAGAALPSIAQDPAPAQAPAVAEPSPANLAIAQEIVDLSMPPESRQAMMQQMTDTMFTQMREGLSRAAGDLSDPASQDAWHRYLERVRTATRDLDNESMPAMIEAITRAYVLKFGK